MIVFSVLHNWVAVTRGPNGIPGIPTPELFGLQIDSVFKHFVFSLLLGGVTLALIWLVLHAPFGRLVRAVRDDEVAAAALGKNTPQVKLLSFVLGASTAAVPGVMFAGYLRYIDPTSFTLMEAIFILSIVVIGGAGSFWGPILGAAFLVLLPEMLRFLQLPDAIAANCRQVIYGVLLVLLMRYRPQGFLGAYGFK